LKELKKVIEDVRVHLQINGDVKGKGEEMKEVLEREEIKSKKMVVSTDKLVKAVVNEYKDSLELKNKGGKL